MLKASSSPFTFKWWQGLHTRYQNTFSCAEQELRIEPTTSQKVDSLSALGVEHADRHGDDRDCSRAVRPQDQALRPLLSRLIGRLALAAWLARVAETVALKWPVTLHLLLDSPSSNRLGGWTSSTFPRVQYSQRHLAVIWAISGAVCSSGTP